MVNSSRLGFRGALLVTLAGLVAGLLEPGLAFGADPLSALQRICGSDSNAKLVADSFPVRPPPAQTSPADTSTFRLAASVLQDATAYGDAAKQLYNALWIDTTGGAAADIAAADDMSQLARILQWTSLYPVAGAMHQCVANRAERADDPFPIRLGRAFAALAEYEAIFVGHDAVSRGYFDKSIATLKPLGDQASGDLATATSGLANLLLTEGKTDEALQLYREALTLNERDPQCGSDCIRAAISADNLGRFLIGRGNYNDAEMYLSRALTLKLARRGALHDSTATTYQSLAQLDAARDDRTQAISNYRQAIGILRFVTKRQAPAESAVLSRLAEVTGEFGRYLESIPAPQNQAEAVIQYSLSIAARQKMRAGAAGLSETYRSDLDRTLSEPYYRLADILVDADRLIEAEQVISMLKEDEFTGLVQRSPRKRSTQGGIGQQVANEFDKISPQWVTDAGELALLESKPRSTWTPEDVQAYPKLLGRAQSHRALYDRLLVQVQTALRPVDHDAGTGMQVTELGKKVGADPQGAVGIHYVVGERRTAIILVTKRGSFGMFSNVSRKELQGHVKALREGMKTSDGAVYKSARALWQALIAPVLPAVEASGATTLVLSLTDDLRYVPFAALQDETGHYLVERYAVAAWAGAADVSPESMRHPWVMAGMGFSRGRADFDPLPFVKLELEAIVRTDATPDGVIPGTIERDDDFSRAHFYDALQGPANILHIASHFDLRSGDKDKSVLALGKGDETLSLAQLGTLDYQRIELLTLSACDTAVGASKLLNGSYFEGLSAVILNAKAKAVMATLWQVSDRSTAELMRQFYIAHTRSATVTRAHALQQAQLTLLDLKPPAIDAPGGQLSTEASRLPPAGQSWKHPYYWAPFILSGNWL